MKRRGSARRGWPGARLAGIAAVSISSVLIVAAATAAPGGEKGKPEKATPAPTQVEQDHGNSYGPKSTPAPERQSGGESKAKAPKPSGGSSDEAKSGKGGSSTKSASGPRQLRDAGTGDNPQGRGPSGKTQYCHATHSETNPHVLIETNNNALPAHRAHQDEEDIIPAQSGDCPGGSSRGQSLDAPNGGKQQSAKAGGPDGKETYCHSTRSETNPFVVITTSVNALVAHVRHHAGDDIIPPETGDCAGAGGQSVGGQQQQSNGGGPDGKETYCHSTRSETNPFVVITTSVNALAAHVRHHAGDDIIPAVNGECPGAQAGPQQVAARGVDEQSAGPNGDGPQGNPPAGPEGNDRGAESEQAPAGLDDADEPAPDRVAAQRAPADAPGESDVLGEDESSPGGGDSAPAVAEETAGAADDSDDDGDDSLPFTGLGLAAILAAALVLFGAGMAVRRFTDSKDA